MHKCWKTHTQQRKKERRLDETLADGTKNVQHSTPMYRKNPGKQTTYRSPKGNEKQVDYIIIKRRHLRHNKDAEVNDMIHMGRDHRCVMATFMITTPKKDGHRKKEKL